MKKSVHDCDLKSCFLCRNSMAGWISSIAANKKNLDLKKGELIFEEGQPVEGIYFVFSGKVKVHKTWGTEKELVLHFAKPGDMIGYRGLGNEKIYPVTATALEAVTVCFIELFFFESIVEANHPFTFQLMKFYANELQEAEKRMRDLAHMPVKGRIAETIFMLKDRFGKTEEGAVNISLTRNDIASYAGTTHETVFRTIQELVAEKIIDLNGKYIRILNEAALEGCIQNNWNHQHLRATRE